MTYHPVPGDPQTITVPACAPPAPTAAPAAPEAQPTRPRVKTWREILAESRARRQRTTVRRTPVKPAGGGQCREYPREGTDHHGQPRQPLRICH